MRKIMQQRITDYLDKTSSLYPDKKCFVDEKKALSFYELKKIAYKIASSLINKSFSKRPIAIFMDKSVECICAMVGTTYSDNFYTILDTQMPKTRIKKIIETLKPEAIITDEKHEKDVKDFSGEAFVFIYEKMIEAVANTNLVEEAKKRIIATDILYVLFTSGSTGMPKGVVISHQAVIAYTDWVSETFSIDNKTIFGNQTPFYFIMSGLDIYQTLAKGCTMYIIPKLAFSFPGMLLDYLEEKKINTVFWVPTALCMLANLGALKEKHLPELKLVMFGGEVMPTKQLNMWIEEYPDVMFVNQYGPTEMTDICAYYIVKRKISNEEAVPIGYPSSHYDIMLLDENDKLVTGSGVGELCGRGPSLASGYYNDLKKTKEVFVQNPLNQAYPEVIYRTGDLVRKNEYGELVYVSRKDYQIKHLGHRIELGEIEVAVSALEGIDSSCCIYDEKTQKIVMIYTGTPKKEIIIKLLKDKIPEYMIPNRIERLEKMPINLNGKIDRAYLKKEIIGE